MDRSRSYVDYILLYNTERDYWQQSAGIVPRVGHAVTVFPDVSQLCP